MKTFMKCLMLACCWLLTACGGSGSTPSNNPGSAVRLTQAPAGAFSTAIAVAGDGTAMAVWSQGPAPFSLWASRFHPASGWGTPQQIGSGTGDQAWAQLAVNSSGHAVVAWGRMVGNSINLLAATYDPATGWSAPTVLEGSTLINPYFWVSIADGGVASVSWQTFLANYGPNALVQSKYVSGAWTPPETIASETSTTQQTVSANSAGTLFVAYNQYQPDPADSLYHRYNTFARSFDPALGWSAPQSIGNYISEMNGVSYLNPTTTPGHFMPIISVDQQGKTVALWSEVRFAGDSYQITVNSFDPATGWGTPVKISEIQSNSIVSSSLFASDGSANYISFIDWTYYSNAPSVSNIFVAKFKAGSWTCEKVVDSLPTSAQNSAITTGKDGALLLTWLERDGEVTGLWMKSFHPATGWGPATRLDKSPSGVGDYKTVRDSSGKILLMWSEIGAANGGVYVRVL